MGTIIDELKSKLACTNYTSLKHKQLLDQIRSGLEPLEQPKNLEDRHLLQFYGYERPGETKKLIIKEMLQDFSSNRDFTERDCEIFTQNLYTARMRIE